MKKLLMIGVATVMVASASAEQLGTTYSSTVPPTDTVMFTGVSLSDVKSVSAWMAPDSLGTAGKNAIATAYHYSNDGSTLTAQMQWYGGGYTKCVFLELTQQGGDICGRVTGAAYINDPRVDCRGVDFRTHPKATSMTTFKENGTAVYGMCDLHLSPRVELAADNTFTGMMRADNYATLAVSAGAELSFGNSSALDWGANRLTITGAAEAHTLRFGTDANGLSAEQMKRIRWNGNRAKLDANGYLHPYVPGLVISAH